MRAYQYYLFDLDGTITDSGLGIINSVVYALKKLGIEVSDRKKLECFIGPPLEESFSKYFGFSEKEAIHAVSLYREYYKEKGILENQVYPGIEVLLKELNEKGKTVALATSKPEIFAKKILEYFHLSEYFGFIGGSNLDGTRTKKSEVIEYVLSNLGNPPREQVIMVGDREHDIYGAKQTGISSLGVLFGYGNRSELEEAGADHIAESVEQIQMLCK